MTTRKRSVAARDDNPAPTQCKRDKPRINQWAVLHNLLLTARCGTGTRHDALVCALETRPMLAACHDLLESGFHRKLWQTIVRCSMLRGAGADLSTSRAIIRLMRASYDSQQLLNHSVTLTQAALRVATSHRCLHSNELLTVVESLLPTTPQMIRDTVTSIGHKGVPAMNGALRWVVRRVLASGKVKQNNLLRQWCYDLHQSVQIGSMQFVNIALQLWYYSQCMQLHLPVQRCGKDGALIRTHCPHLHSLLDNQHRPLPVYFLLVLTLLRHWFTQITAPNMCRALLALTALDAWCEQFSAMTECLGSLKPLDSLLLVYTLCDQYMNVGVHAKLNNTQWSAAAPAVACDHECHSHHQYQGPPEGQRTLVTRLAELGAAVDALPV